MVLELDCVKALTVVKVLTIRSIQRPLRNGSRGDSLGVNFMTIRYTSDHRIQLTVPVRGSHWRPPLQPPDKQDRGPGLVKSHSRLPCKYPYETGYINQWNSVLLTHPNPAGLPVVGDIKSDLSVRWGFPTVAQLRTWRGNMKETRLTHWGKLAHSERRSSQ